MKSACQAGQFNGPPSCTPFQPPPPANLDKSESAPPVDVPADEGTTYESATPEAAKKPAPKSSSPERSSPDQKDDGSIDTCGSRGGLTCKTGLCCSQYGYVRPLLRAHFFEYMLTVGRYCGTSKDYCGDGCQSAFGTCGSSHYRREHKRHGHPHMKK